MEKNELQKYLSKTTHTLAELSEHFSLTPAEVEKTILPFLDSGLVFLTNSGYGLTANYNIKLCTVVLRKNNFAFVRPIDGPADKSKDIRISGYSLNGYILEDVVYVQVDHWNNGKIVGLYNREKRINGKVSREGANKFLLNSARNADSNIKIIIREDLSNFDIKDGDLISCHILESRVDEIEVSFDKLLVKSGEVGSDISSIIVSNDAPLTFPSDVLVQAKMIPSSVSEADLEGRTDFRDENIVTIDGEDALDFDDAVQVKKIINGYEVGVHIADVSYYVKPNSAIDEEAQKRGTSIYVADRVVPMIPVELSNGICSLNPDVDRLTISVIMDVDSSGKVYRSKIVPGVIHSHGRLTYTQVNDYLKGEKVNLSQDIKDMLLLLRDVTSKIRKRREKFGALDLDSTEIKFKLDEQGNPIEVIKRTQEAGEKLIEDLMIIANVEVAKFLEARGIPTLFRVHDNPPQDKLTNFKLFLRNIHMSQDFPQKVTSQTLSHWFRTIADDPQRSAISNFLLRSLAKAQYSPYNTGHFGLGEDNYLHFTSPIRRYPDLIVHRTIRDYVFNQEKFVKSQLLARLRTLGYSTSAAERRATKIERDVDDLESAKYMSKHIGETFKGHISGLNAQAIFIELENGIEGGLSLNDIDPTNKYKFSEKHMNVQSLSKEVEMQLFKLGQEIEVIVKDVDFNSNRVNFITPVAQKIAEAAANYQRESYRDTQRLSHTRDNSRLRYSKDRKSSYRGRDDRNSSYSRDKKSSYRGRDDRNSSYSRDKKSSYRGRDDRNSSYSRDKKSSYRGRDDRNNSYSRYKKSSYRGRDDRNSSYSRDKKSSYRTDKKSNNSYTKRKRTYNKD